MVSIIGLVENFLVLMGRTVFKFSVAVALVVILAVILIYVKLLDPRWYCLYNNSFRDLLKTLHKKTPIGLQSFQ